MYFVDNENTYDARINLAIEEYLLRNILLDEDILLFYINGPSIIIGRNQNTLEEINQAYVEAHEITVVRRLSGGGAVYHDLGNLNFSFISRNGKENLLNYKKFTAPVVRALNHMGIPAELGGRNDILVDGRKISGNASYSVREGVVSHGTLLFDSDLSHLTDALNVKPGKIISKGIKSIRSRVANISEFLREPMSVEDFRQSLLQSIFEGADPIPQYRLGESDWKAIHELSAQRYQSWEWNYGRSPEFNVRKTHRFPFGEIDACIDVQNGVIASARLYGDFLGDGELSDVEKLLAGARYDREGLKRALDGFDTSRYFGGLSTQDFLEFLFGELA